MYIHKTSTYYNSHGQQHIRKADFLILMQSKKLDCGPHNFSACVRKVALAQFGCFMMGTARIGGESFTVDGAYGNLGLPITVPHEIWEKYGIPVPHYLYKLWDRGGGHNGCGAEVEKMRKWAIKCCWKRRKYYSYEKRGGDDKHSYVVFRKDTNMTVVDGLSYYSARITADQLERKARERRVE